MKRFFKGLVLVFALFIGLTGVKAENITLDQVIDKFDDAALGAFMENVTMTNDSTNKKLVFKVDGTSVMEMTYDEGISYLAWDSGYTTADSNFGNAVVAQNILIANLTDELRMLSGVADNMVLKDDVPMNDYDTNGVSGTYLTYTDGSSEVTALSNFKITLDKDKIKTLYDNYGEEGSYGDSYLNSYVPTVSYGNVTSNSVTLTAKASAGDVYSTPVYCIFYRSTEENGTYTRVNEEAIECNGTDSYVDTGLTANTTYYYKAIIVGGANYSDPVKVTTSVKEAVTNPKTGVTTNVLAIILVAVLACVVLLTYLNKNNLFKKSL